MEKKNKKKTPFPRKARVEEMRKMSQTSNKWETYAPLDDRAQKYSEHLDPVGVKRTTENEK